MRLGLSVLAVSLVGLTACRNPCQKLCRDMLQRAEECGYTVPEGQMDTCIEEHKRKELEEGDREVCSDFRDDIAIEWSCEEVGRRAGLTQGGGGDEN